jgi:hypothetical protein
MSKDSTKPAEGGTASSRAGGAEMPTASARFFKLGVGVFLMLTGLTVTALLFIPWQRAKETRAWSETPCVITESYSKEAQSGDLANTTHRVFLRYRYEFGGREFTGTRWRRVVYAGEEDDELSRKTPHSSEAEKLLEAYPVGKATTCWVNPAAPDEAVLEHQSGAAIYTLWWPMLFAVGGAGMVWSVLRRKSLRGRYGPAVASVPGFNDGRDRGESDDGES